MDIQDNSVVTDVDTEILDGEITQISNDFSETYYFDGEQEEELEMLVAKAMKLGELYERKKWQAAKAQAVPEVAQRQGGYYIRDLRSQPGNCMKFWYQAGYGTKHKNFFWCATLEEAKKYKGGCDWFEIWHAPYIDSLVEYTVDFQLADRGVGLVDLKAQEPAND